MGLNFFKCKKCGAVISFDNDYYNAHRDEAVKAWNQRVLPSNPPLTLDELRGMGNDWVWIELLVSTYGTDSGYYFKNERRSNMKKFYCGYPGVVNCILEYSGYGATWKAYRHRPELLKEAQKL